MSQRVRHLTSHLTASSTTPGAVGHKTKILIANRGEIAVRIIRAAREMGLETVAVYEKNDVEALHTLSAEQSVKIDSYNSIESIVEVCKKKNIDLVHPGYGFLSENEEFAARLQNEQIQFVGPSPSCLRIFGNKLLAKSVARECDVPVLIGSEILQNGAEARAFMKKENLSFPVMFKTALGGGGTGVVKVDNDLSLDLTVKKFASMGFFIEECFQDAMDVEVQIFGDKHKCVHLYDRECSIQANHQKLIEIAPAISLLGSDIRSRLFESSVRIANKVKYSSAGTVEYLVASDRSRFAFLEVNPRVQVEHTVTEEVTGVDIVQTQLEIASGKSLTDLGLYPQGNIDSTGFAVQSRVNMTGAGTVSSFVLPSGKGIRVDSMLKPNLELLPLYNPLLAKLVVSFNTWETLQVRLQTALDSTFVNGVETNLSQLRAIVRHPHFGVEPLTVTFLQDEATKLADIKESLVTPVHQQGATKKKKQKIQKELPGGLVGIRAHASSSVSKVLVSPNQTVEQGDTLCVLTSMKMDTIYEAETSGTVQELFIKRGDVVDENDFLLWIEPTDVLASTASTTTTTKLSKARQLALDAAHQSRSRIFKLRAMAEELGGSEAVRNHKLKGTNRMNIRERIHALVNQFKEVGRMAGKYNEENDTFTPGNFVLGTGLVDNRRVVVGGEDYTIAGGSPNLAGLRKSVYCETLALNLRIPLIRLHEGGGGSVRGANAERRPTTKKQVKPSSGDAVFTRPRFESVGQCLATIPTVTAALGPVAGLPAARLVSSHFSVMVKDAVVLIAGPKVVENALGYSVEKEELGGFMVHTRNGVVDNVASSEEDALRQIRKFLSFFPSNVDEEPPVVETSDSPDRMDESLLTMVSAVNHREVYDARVLIDAIFDKDSVFEVGRHFGVSQITCYARLNGKPVGVICNDSAQSGGALSETGSRKIRRHMEICETFSLPIVFLVDEPGFMIGLEAEQQGTIRTGTGAVLRAANLSVISCSVIMRKAFGVAAAAHFAPNGTTFIWPTATVGALPIEAGVAVGFKRLLDSIPDVEEREAKRLELEETFKKRTDSFPRAESFACHDMISPEETRPCLIDWLETHWPLVSRHVKEKNKDPRNFVI